MKVSITIIGAIIHSIVTDPDDIWPDPDPFDLQKFSAKLLLKIFLAEIFSKKYIHEPKN
jgi:hypothetical protein